MRYVAENYYFRKIMEVREIGITELDLSYTDSLRYDGIEKLNYFPDELFSLDSLELLRIDSQDIHAIPERISELSNLAFISLRSNKLSSFPSSLVDLKKMKGIDLGGNQLSSIDRSLLKLEELEFIDISNNRFATFPENIALLANLTKLNISHNLLKELPDYVDKLLNLRSLNISSNKFVNFPLNLGKLRNMEELDVSANAISNLSDWLDRLSTLKILILSNNELEFLPASIGKLTNLEKLEVKNNHLSDLPKEIGALKMLSYIDLGDNLFEEIPDVLYELKSLKSLVLKNSRSRLTSQISNNVNRIKRISSLITDLENLEKLDVSGNPIEIPPPEIVNIGLDAINTYFRHIKVEGIDYLYEAKLLIVGEAGAGKTTLAKKIIDPNYLPVSNETSTEGIGVLKWDFLIANNQIFRVNVWDFGGQEIYHSTHQFFLTRRSLYALVADTRKEDTDFYYWLNIIELLSDSSPTLIIENEKQDRHREINERALRSEFANLKEVICTNLATNRGFEDVVKRVIQYIQQLPHVGTPLPRTWVKVRDVLEKDHRNYIDLQEFLRICDDNGFTLLKEKLQLSTYLHDLGVCLHFQDDELLKKTIILKPKWGTDAVYKVLDNKQIRNNFGHFSKTDAANIWDGSEYIGMEDELLQLMINFKLCYRIPNTKDMYIAPQLLADNHPEYKWISEDNLVLRYSYEFMPKGIITQFIVALHDLISQQNLVWKSGVVLEKRQLEAKAEVVQNYNRKEISIRISGKHKKELMVIIMHELDKIQATYKRLKYSTLIPCNCSTCRMGGDKTHFYKFELLLKFVGDQQTNIQCPISYEMVNVRGMIDNVIDRKNQESIEVRGRQNVIFRGEVGQVVVQNFDGDVVTMKRAEEVSMSKKNQTAWANGLFYVFVFLVVVAALGVLAKNIPWYDLAAILVAALIFVPLIGALQLRQDKTLSEKGFLELVRITIRQLPLINRVSKDKK